MALPPSDEAKLPTGTTSAVADVASVSAPNLLAPVLAPKSRSRTRELSYERKIDALVDLGVLRAHVEAQFPDLAVSRVANDVKSQYPDLEWQEQEIERMVDLWCHNSDISDISTELVLRPDDEIRAKIDVLDRVFTHLKNDLPLAKLTSLFTIYDGKLFTREELARKYYINEIKQDIGDFSRLPVPEWTVKEKQVLLDHYMKKTDKPLTRLWVRTIDEINAKLLLLQPPIHDSNIPQQNVNRILDLLSKGHTHREIGNFIPQSSLALIVKLDSCLHDDSWTPKQDQDLISAVIAGNPVLGPEVDAFARYWRLVFQPPPPVERGKIPDDVSDVEDYDESDHQEYLNYLEERCNKKVTTTSLQKHFPTITLSQLLRDISVHNFRKANELTKFEVAYIRQLVNHDVSLQDTLREFPFHDAAVVESKYKTVKMAGSKRKVPGRSSIEQLIYEAQWYSTYEDMGPRSRRRGTRRNVEQELNQIEQQAHQIKNIVVKPKEYTEEELKSREQARIARLQVKLRKEQEKKRQQEERRLWRLNNPHLVAKAKTKSNNNIIKQMLADAEYFQSVTGDGKLIKTGDKRHRKQATHFIPEFKDRSAIKKVQRKLLENRLKELKKKIEAKKSSKTRTYKRRRKNNSSTPDGNASDDTNDDNDDDSFEESLKEARDALDDSPGPDADDGLDSFSPYDPTDIIHDSYAPLHDRKLFVESVYEEYPHISKINFTEDVDNESMNTMFRVDDSIPGVNTVAVEVISKHFKNYRDLASTFPPITIRNQLNQRLINPLNKLRVRFLLHPGYSEMFILAEPKSNELDPVFEVQKIFQIHYALYFSSSEKLKKTIYFDFCKGLEVAISNNSFSDFMFIIDSWNSLMIKLSPNPIDFDTSIDINSDLRTYLTERRIPSDEDTNLSLFVEELMNVDTVLSPSSVSPMPENITKTTFSNVNMHISVPTPPADDDSDHPPQVKLQNLPHPTTNPSPSSLVSPTSSGHLLKDVDPVVQSEIKRESDSSISLDSPANKTETNPSVSLESPVKIESEDIEIKTEKIPEFTRPENYSEKFFQNLKSMTEVSRFCLQQLLLRAYTRIVSPNSQKLRSYKAFTAEVYGELLPSFVSEVLTKVNLLPNHRFYDLGSGVGNTTFQAALEFGVKFSGGCELMEHASKLTQWQHSFLDKQMKVFGLNKLPLDFALLQSFVDNEQVRKEVIDCDVLIVNNYLFDFPLNVEVGKLLYGLKPGTKIISLRNFIPPRYKAGYDLTVFDYLTVEKHEMSDFLSVSWTANKVPYYISTVQDSVRPEFL